MNYIFVDNITPLNEAGKVTYVFLGLRFSTYKSDSEVHFSSKMLRASYNRELPCRFTRKPEDCSSVHLQVQFYNDHQLNIYYLVFRTTDSEHVLTKLCIQTR